jgi:3',5'-cyclic AMP phosphodiesterase CpdA
MGGEMTRRHFVKLLGFGAAVFMSGAGSKAFGTTVTSGEDFMFLQMSDTHWGFSNPAVNPDFAGTLKKAIASVNGLRPQPDFVVFTGDLSHVTDDPNERKKRLSGFRDIIKGLRVQNIRLLPGEHDAAPDNGATFKEFFGDTHYSFDHKGVHFIALDNVSDPRAMVGDGQIQWLATDLKERGKDERIVVLTHRPLFSLYPNGTGPPGTGQRLWNFSYHTKTSLSSTGISTRSATT